MRLNLAVVATWCACLGVGTGAEAAASPAPAVPAQVVPAQVVPAQVVPGPDGPTPDGPAPVSYAAPLPGAVRVVRAFEPPVTRYGRGHLGVDLATTPGETVRAAAAGRVTFAGQVAGRGVVVIVHRDGIRTEYEPVRSSVHRGEAVRLGEPIGQLRGRHGACAPGRCLHWSARRGSVYLDPLGLLRPLGPVRLLPWSQLPGG